MFCPKCGNEVKAETGICSNCGFDINSVKPEEERKNTEETIKEETKVETAETIPCKPAKKESNSCKGASIAAFAFAGLFFILGLYKMLVYENGESYSSTPVNAYVGGDAYNLIINGAYAAGYFALTAGFLALGIGLLIYGELVFQRKK